MKKRQVVIIGAGASGLMAAIMAARNGAAVTVLEQNEKPGKKICATGNGKCNFSNLVMPDDAYRGKHPEFVNHALAQFSVKDTVEFFKKLGIFPLDKNGYLYPRSNQAQSVSLFIDGKFYKSERGELQLTEYGISGIPVFQISTYAIRAVRDGHKAALRINFMPELSEEELKQLLHSRKKACPYKN